MAIHSLLDGSIKLQVQLLNALLKTSVFNFEALAFFAKKHHSRDLLCISRLGSARTVRASSSIIFEVLDLLSETSVVVFKLFPDSSQLLDLPLGLIEILHQLGHVGILAFGRQVIGPVQLILSQAVLEVFNLSLQYVILLKSAVLPNRL